MSDLQTVALSQGVSAVVNIAPDDHDRVATSPVSVMLLAIVAPVVNTRKSSWILGREMTAPVIDGDGCYWSNYYSFSIPPYRKSKGGVKFTSLFVDTDWKTRSATNRNYVTGD